MATSTRAQIVTPDLLNAAQVPADMLAMGVSLEPSLVPRFLTTSARDSAITSTVLAADVLGGEGLRCYVKGIGQLEYRSGWKPVGPYAMQTMVYAGSPMVSSTSVGPANIPNVHGVTYALPCKRWVSYAVDATCRGDTVNQQYRLYLFDDSGTFIDWRDNIAVADGPGAQWISTRSRPRLLSAGTRTVGGTFSLTSGAGSVSLSSLTLTIVDEAAGV